MNRPMSGSETDKKPAVILLSGGLDSAIVCSLMAELVDMKTIKSFTVGMANLA